MILEELLNKLIKKGWKPRWYEDVYKFKLYKLWYTIARPQKQKMISFATETRHYINWTDYIWYKWYSLRELVSKESWLWQFVCENGMLDRHKYDSKTYEVRIENWIKRREIWPEWEVSINNSWRWRWSAEYRLIESALCDEDKLEEFLVSNIKIDE